MAADLLELGRRLLEERPAVLTFNYDTIIESVIESASGPSDLPELRRGGSQTTSSPTARTTGTGR